MPLGAYILLVKWIVLNYFEPCVEGDFFICLSSLKNGQRDIKVTKSSLEVAKDLFKSMFKSDRELWHLEIKKKWCEFF